MKRVCFLEHLFGNASTVLECSCCRIHSNVAAPFCSGLVCIHAAALFDNIMGLPFVLLSALLTGLSYLSSLLVMFAWKQDFLQAARAVRYTELEDAVAGFERGGRCCLS